MDDDAMDLLLDDEDEAVLAAIADRFQNDDLEDGDHREEVLQVDIEGWRRMSNASFKENFRMDRVIFERFIAEVGLHMRNTNRIIRLRTNLELCLLMGLWPIINPDTFRSISHHFGKKKAVIHYHYAYLIEVLREMAPRYIKWPTALERAHISSHFEEHYGYPGVVGCIDGVYINVTAPLEQPQRYVNRHHTYAMLVQAVSDHRLLYRDVYCGEPGCIGDVRNFNKSPLSKNLLTSPDMLSDGEHIIGDGAYTLTDKLLKPYADDGRLSRRQRTHNICLSACRSSVERSFCLLKGKKRRLKKLPMRNPFLVIDHIIASFVIHNFIVLEGNDAEGILPVEPRNIPQEEFEHLDDEARNIGPMKREYIAYNLYPDND